MKNTELAHIWASQTKSSGKAGNMSFNEDGIYSYSKMIAAFRQYDTVFVDRLPYSHTTTKHQSQVIQAVSHYSYFIYNSIPSIVSDVEYIRYNPGVVSLVQIWEQYHQIYNKLIERSTTKKYIRTIATTLALIEQYATKMNQLRTLFDLDVQKIEYVVNPEVQKLIDKNTQRQNEIKIIKFEQSKIDREAWLSGERYTYPNANDNPIVLRILPTDCNIVETSRGAFVPLNVCKRLYTSFMVQVMPDDCSVGNYKLKSITTNEIKIGCHTISADELHRFASVLGIN